MLNVAIYSLISGSPMDSTPRVLGLYTLTLFHLFGNNTTFPNCSQYLWLLNTFYLTPTGIIMYSFVMKMQCLSETSTHGLLIRCLISNYLFQRFLQQLINKLVHLAKLQVVLLLLQSLLVNGFFVACCHMNYLTTSEKSQDLREERCMIQQITGFIFRTSDCTTVVMSVT